MGIGQFRGRISVYTVVLVSASSAALGWGVAIIVMDVGSRVSVTGTMLISQLPQIACTVVMVANVTRAFDGLTGPSLATMAGAGFAFAILKEQMARSERLALVLVLLGTVMVGT